MKIDSTEKKEDSRNSVSELFSDSSNLIENKKSFNLSDHYEKNGTFGKDGVWKRATLNMKQV